MDDIRERLAKVAHHDLVDFIARIYGDHASLDDRIDALMAKDDKKLLLKTLKKKVTSLKRSTRFIDYQQSFEFSRSLDALLDDIQQLMLPSHPKEAFQLLDAFLLTASQTIERVDDSSGSVGDSYHRCVLLWLAAAAAWRDSG